MRVENFWIHRVLKEKMIWVVLGFSILYWVQESLINVFFYQNTNFINEFLNPELHELWHRVLTVLIFIYFSAFVNRMIKFHMDAEDRVKLANVELNKIFNTAADGMRLVDLNYNILRVNDTFSDMIGLKKDDIKEKKCYDVFNGRLCHTEECPLTRIANGESNLVTDIIKVKPDGSKVHCILTATPYTGLDGELRGIVEDFKDVSDFVNTSEALKKSEERYRLLVENSPFGIFFLGTSGDILGWNSKFSEIAGEDFKEGEDIFESVFFKRAGIVEEIKSVLADGTLSSFEKPYKKNGAALYLKYTISPFDFEGDRGGPPDYYRGCYRA